MESSGFKSNGGSLLKMKEFEQEYRDQGAYHHRLEGFSQWWMFDNYRILASWVESEGRTLDLACGDGMIWRFLKTSDIIGVDHAPTGLRHSRQFARLPLVQADMMALPFKAGSIRNTVCSLSFQYLPGPDLERCFHELSRIMIKDGRLAFSYPNIRPPGKGVNLSHAALPYAELKAKLRNSGFRPAAVRGISLRMPPRFVRWSVHPFLKPLAGLYYRMSKIARFFPRRSYHYALCCLNTGEGSGS